jgi:hypothetical protein
MSSSILELLTVTAITPMRAVGHPQIRSPVIDITANIAGQRFNAQTPSDGGVHAGSQSDPSFFASAEAYPVGAESFLRSRPRNLELDPRTDGADRGSAPILGLSVLGQASRGYITVAVSSAS